MKVLFITGFGIDSYPISPLSKNAPNWLKKGYSQLPDEYKGDEIFSEVAMAIYIQYINPKIKIDLVPYTIIKKLTKSFLEQYDFVYNFFEIIDIANCLHKKGQGEPVSRLCYNDYLKFLRVFESVRNTKVYPYPELYRFIVDKTKYYRALRKAGIPTSKFFTRTVSRISKDSASMNKFLQVVASKKNWKGVIIKPSFAYYSSNILVIKNPNTAKSRQAIRKYITRLSRNNFKTIVIQEFIPSFGENFELRTFWLDGKYAYTLGTFTPTMKPGEKKTQEVIKTDTFKSEGGSLSNSIKRRLIAEGKKILNLIPKSDKNGNPILIRIDFACCLDKNGIGLRNYFVNEIEVIMTSGSFAGMVSYPIAKKMGKVIASRKK